MIQDIASFRTPLNAALLAVLALPAAAQAPGPLGAEAHGAPSGPGVIHGLGPLSRSAWVRKPRPAAPAGA